MIESTAIKVRVTPNAKRTQVLREAPDLTGETLLRVYVTAPPADGAANKAVLEALAEALGLPKKSVTLKAGLTARTKTFLLGLDQEQLAARLQLLPLYGAS